MGSWMDDRSRQLMEERATRLLAPFANPACPERSRGEPAEEYVTFDKTAVSTVLPSTLLGAGRCWVMAGSVYLFTLWLSRRVLTCAAESRLSRPTVHGCA